MNAILISIGDELLIGQVVNTNASWLGARLTEIGVTVTRTIVIGDDRELIRKEIEAAAAAADVVIAGGGLGPTHDDVTREAFCDMLGCDMRMDEEQLELIKRRFADRGIELNERSIRQALAPSACRTLPNHHGSAPGLACTVGSARIYALPGVPDELKGIFNDGILPELAASADEIEQTTFLIFGPTESALADSLADLNDLLGADLTLAFLPSTGGIRLRAMRRGNDPELHGRYTRLLTGIRERAGEWIVADRDESLAAALGDLLTERGLTLAMAESCTGGMIGALLTDIPGSSTYFLGGIIAYAYEAKETFLGVPSDMLLAYGAVSREVAETMAREARDRFGADIAAAVTGIAGPGGATDTKPVGTVWIAVATEQGIVSKKFLLGKERPTVRTRAANIVLDMIRREALRLEVPTAG